MLKAPEHTLLAPTWANNENEENKIENSSVKTLVEFLIKIGFRQKYKSIKYFP